jgi:selenocysteine-specific translation elongation factor
MRLKEMFIVIDALDECQEEGRPDTIRLLTEVMKSLPCVEVFVTSRKEGDIEQALMESNTQQFRY